MIVWFSHYSWSTKVQLECQMLQRERKDRKAKTDPEHLNEKIIKTRIRIKKRPNESFIESMSNKCRNKAKQKHKRKKKNVFFAKTASKVAKNEQLKDSSATQKRFTKWFNWVSWPRLSIEPPCCNSVGRASERFQPGATLLDWRGLKSPGRHVISYLSYYAAAKDGWKIF